MIKKGNIVMKTKNIFTLAALALTMAACTSEDLTQQQSSQPEPDHSKGLPFTATISGKATTRAITENTTDGTLETSWKVDEKVALMHNGVVDVMTVSEVDPTTKAATITGTITGSPTDGEEVALIYPASVVDVSGPEVKTNEQLLGSQDGTLATIAEKYDLRTCEDAKLKVVSGSATINGTVSLQNQLAIVKFSLTDGTSALSASKFEILDKTGSVITTVTPSSAASEFYVAMPPANAQAFHFIAKKGDEKYYYSKYGATLVAGKYYQQDMTLADMLHTPLTLEATEDATTITVTNATAKTFQYAKNGGDRITVPGTDISISINTGDIVQFYSTNAGLGNGNIFNIQPDKKTYVYGNVMSLIDDGTEGFANDKTIEGKDALGGLFKGASLLVSHAMKKILLPATTLKDGCYQDMFNGCTGLTTAPDLPATTLATDCYTGMFKGCTGLTTAPDLPATELKNECYKEMFAGCTGLTSLPADLLPAKTLAAKCYAQMFHSCTGLTTLPANLLPATTLESHCYAYMFTGCSGLTTLPANLLPVTTLYNSCYWGMFENCTSLTTAPDLPAQTLVGSCYHLLFDGCTKLSSVKCLATSISATNCLTDWLKGAGTADGCERKLYVDPSTNFSDNDWKLDSSGEDGKRWTTNSNSVAASQ